MALNLKELEGWFQERPKWLQDAARQLIEKGELSDQDITELLSLCGMEATGQTITYSGIPEGSLGIQDTTKPLHLEAISDVQGINALSPTKPLTFGNKPICIVYGRNGTGKSGYVRLLKHVCGTRRPGDLHGNIFKETPQPQSANLLYSDHIQPMISPWNGKPIPDLFGIDIYDTACGLVYVNEDNEVIFEPWLLRLFSKLTAVCEFVKNHLESQIKAQVTRKPSFPAEYLTTSIAKWYEALSADKSADEVDSQTDWKAEHESELNEINQRLAETDPATKAATLRRQATSVAELLLELRTQYDALSDEKCTNYLQSKLDVKTKRTVAKEDAKKVFENAPLSGIESESWRLLWESARKYSTELAYPDMPFPNLADGSRCVLCQRELEAESRERFKAFEAFVKGDLQKQALLSEERFLSVQAAIPDIPEIDTLRSKMDAAGIVEKVTRDMIEDFIFNITKRKQTCLTVTNIEDISPLPTTNVWSHLEKMTAAWKKLAVSYADDAKGLNRPQLEAKSKELGARKWLHEQRQSIVSEIARLEKIKNLQSAIELTSTLSLSRRKSKLADELITNTYIARFREELIALGAQHLLVDLKKTRTESGRVYHRIMLRNTLRSIKTSDILSEGEFRIVSLAAFLADTGGRGAKTPFIFDDPISSLDQVYEEAAAQRLVAVSRNRQVIIFTHRLSLVGLLEKYSNKANIDTTIICLSRIRTGDITELPINLMKTRQAANRLLNERIKSAKTAFKATDDEYEKEAKGLCRDIRILLEQIVESDLLGGIVRRYNPEVQTKGKIEHLSKITPGDCKFIDEMMTAYSRYEHSQPEEAPVELPKPDEIEKDLKEIAGFIETLKKRKGNT